MEKISNLRQYEWQTKRKNIRDYTDQWFSTVDSRVSLYSMKIIVNLYYTCIERRAFICSAVEIKIRLIILQLTTNNNNKNIVYNNSFKVV